MAPRTRKPGEQLPQCWLLLPDEPDDHLGPAACRLDRAWVREVGGRELLVERQMRKIVSAKPQRKALAADLRIRQVVQFVGEAARFGLGRTNDRTEARQDQHVFGTAADLGDQGLQVGIERLRRRFLQMRGKYRLGVAAANCRPVSDEPACTNTGRPCGERGKFRGPATL